MDYIGVDIGKDDFFADLSDGHPKKFTNDGAGCVALCAAMLARGFKPETTIVGMEATGVYHHLLAASLSEYHWGVAIINPLQVNRIGKVVLRRAKTDSADATLVRKATEAGYGSPAEGVETMLLRALVQERESLVKLRASCRMLKHVALVRRKSGQKTNAIDRLLAVESVLGKQISAVEKEARKIASETQRLLRSIPGVGPASAAALVAKVVDPTRFASPEKLVAFIGLDPRVHESGTSVKGKGFIVKRGDRLLRHVLFLAADTARKYIPELKKYYEDKRTEGKHHFVALCAVERKLVHLIWAVWRRGTPYEKRVTETIST